MCWLFFKNSVHALNGRLLIHATLRTNNNKSNNFQTNEFTLTSFWVENATKVYGYINTRVVTAPKFCKLSMKDMMHAVCNQHYLVFLLFFLCPPLFSFLAGCQGNIPNCRLSEFLKSYMSSA